MAAAAAPEMPNHADMARRMLEVGIPNAYSRKPAKLKDGKLHLTQVWDMGAKIRNLARRMGVTAENHPARRPNSPEELDGELRAQGITAHRDMGSITGLEQIRQTLRETGVQEIYADARSKLWNSRESRANIGMGRGAYNGNGRNQIALREGENPEELRTQTEWELMILTVPGHPAHEDAPTCSPEAAVGFVNWVPPKAAREYLDGKSDDPNPPQPDPCPKASECPSRCGALQRTGEFPFSLTYDGRYESCGYWQFLERYGAIDPARRESFAAAAIEAELGKSKRKQPEKPQEEGPAETETGRENAGPESRQATLF